MALIEALAAQDFCSSINEVNLALVLGLSFPQHAQRFLMFFLKAFSSRLDVDGNFHCSNVSVEQGRSIHYGSFPSSAVRFESENMPPDKTLHRNSLLSCLRTFTSTRIIIRMARTNTYIVKSSDFRSNFYW